MRNLFVSKHREFSLQGLKLSSEEILENQFVVDCLKEAIYFLSDGIVYKFSTEFGTLEELFNVKEYYRNEEKHPAVAGMCYFQVTDCLIIALDKGDLLSINCSALGEVECVGFVQSGLTLMEPSPDEDIVVLLTCQNSVITMTGSFDPINEANLQQIDFGENQFITVGWGRKETQFHGSEGKAAALAKPIDQTAPLLTLDKGQPQISWRGDGALFAVCCVNQETGNRFVRVYDRKGDLMYTSENIPGLEGVVAWRPSGNVMACTQRMPNKHVVCFLEKNGLRHGDFTLPFPLDTVHVRQLLWNSESTILLVWCKVLESASPPTGVRQTHYHGQSTLLLWTIGNYHWYLKQRIDLCAEYCPSAIRWDQDVGNRLHIICHGSKYGVYDFSWRVDHSNGLNQNDGTFVGVIDGDSLLMTSFRHNVIPPPMCGTTLKLQAPVSEVVFAPQHLQCCSVKDVENRYLNTSSTEDSGFGDLVETISSNSNNFCVVLSNGLFSVFSYVGSRHAPNPSHIPVGNYQLGWESEEEVIPNHCLHHWTWMSRETMLCSATVGNNSCLCLFDMGSVGAAHHGRIVLRKQISLSNSVISIVMGLDGLSALIQLTGGKVIRYDIESGSLSDVLAFPQPAVKIMVCAIANDIGNVEEVILGLTSHNRLYANADLIMSNVTSIDLHTKFLLITTSQQQLLCCPLKISSLLSLPKPSVDSESSFGVINRKVERGSRLVVVVPDGNRVILQMPRGNLECIEPRALSLCQLSTLLDSRMYYEAFDLARKQRINLNLFVDHDPNLFLQNMDLFVKHVSNPQWLCLFLAELQDEDCSTSMYKAHYPQTHSESLSNKTNKVCEAFLTTVNQMNEKDAAKWTLPVLTAYVMKQSPDGLESALTLIKNLKQSEDKLERPVHWTSALQHLLYLRDVNQLMDAALGMYDFNLVVLVASKSQKDPKEYLAFLNTLRQMESNYQRFTVDKHLRKWESALFNLIQCPDDHSDELLQFVKNQGLFKEALALLPRTDTRFRMIASEYADKLVSLRLYREAGVMYRRAADYPSALQAHVKALAWRNCIQDADAAGLGSEDRQVLFLDLSNLLQDAGQFGEAALILHSYLQQPVEAVKVLCCGHVWAEALRIISVHHLNDLIEAVVHPSTVEYAETLSTQIKSISEQFNTNNTRLAEVRREKQLARERRDAVDGDVDFHGESDLLSDTSSMTGSSLSSRSSSHSSSSNRSGKNRRKLERKVLSLKKGSPHEELALIHALHQNMSTAFSLREEVHSLNCTLVDFGDDAVAGDLQNLLFGTLKVMEFASKSIWPASAAPGNNSAPLTFGPNATSNMLAASNVNLVAANQLDMTLLDPQYRFAPVIHTIKWELDILKRKLK